MRISRSVHINWLFLCLLALGLTCCEKKELGPQQTENIDHTNNTNSGDENTQEDPSTVYVVNEGNYGQGNASITLYDKEEKTEHQQVFLNANNRLLGDVGQSMTKWRGKWYIPVNNSGKVEVVEGKTMNSEGKILGLNSPRYFLGLQQGKAYVSDLYDNGVHIIDPAALQVTGKISINGWTEEMVEAGGKVYVANKDSSRVEVIDPGQDQVIRSITVAMQPNSLVKDKDGMLWILCDGGFQKEKPSLFRLNPETDSIMKELEFPNIQNSPGNLCMNGDKDVLYFLNGGVFEMGIHQQGLPQIPVIPENGRTLYTIKVDSSTSDVYIADAKDYVTKGDMYRYDVNGNPIDTFPTGVTPGTIAFE